MAKVTIAKVEFGPDGKSCRVFLSNGDELGGLISLGVPAVKPACHTIVEMVALVKDQEV